MLVKFLSSSTPAAASASMARSNNNNEDDIDGDEGNNGNCNTLVTKRTLTQIKKRKGESWNKISPVILSVEDDSLKKDCY